MISVEVITVRSYQIFKERREATGLTVREFCEKVNISTGAFVEYQNGTKSLLCLPLGKAVRIFSVIDIDIEKFYDEYFPELWQETEKKLVKWRSEHPAELKLDKLRRRYRARIAKAKERKTLIDVEIDDLLRDFKKTFKELEMCVDDKGMISKTLYDEKILPLSYKMKQKLDGSEIENDVSNLINDAILKSEMTYAELGDIVDVTPRRLTMCKTSKEGYSSMKIGSVLKICYVLNIPFDTIRMHC